MPSPDVTELLLQWRSGDKAALDALMPLVYQELHGLAHNYLRNERPNHTLRSTALVHEAYLRMVSQKPLDTENRAHFIAVAARLMRQILVDYARTRGAAKRGANLQVQLDEALVWSSDKGPDIVALDDALQVLAEMDEQQSRIVELRFFGGLTTEETAQVLEVSPATVKRDWSVAKAWLTRQMRRGERGETESVGKN